MSIESIMHENYHRVRTRMQQACERAGRNLHELTLVAVSKKQAVEKLQALQELASEDSLRVVFGENYVQEWRDKRGQFDLKMPAHMIGPLQSNKARLAVQIFDTIQSVHSEKLYGILSKEAQKADKSLDIFLQVNISKDPAKSGFQVEQLIEFVRTTPFEQSRLKLKGLMAITAFYEQAEQARGDFRELKQVRGRVEEVLRSRNPGIYGGLELSMGMSADFEIAIEEGASVVRVGTALFGERRHT